MSPWIQEKKRALAVIFAAFILLALSPQSATAKVTAKNENGSSISIPKRVYTKAANITVVGRNFDETAGIYLAFCVVPKKGELPTPCGGGVNASGTGESSLWISSNPPPYGQGLATEFLPGGRFQEKVKIAPQIGKFDCRKVRCAITVRADHIRGSDRSRDIFIPIIFR